MSSEYSPDSLRRLLCGAHCGVLESVGQAELEPDDLPIYLYGGKISRTEAIGGHKAPQACSGAGLDRDSALAACLGEGVERYCAALEWPGNVQVKSRDSLRQRSLGGDSFPLFSKRQYKQLGFPFSPWSDKLPVGWVEAQNWDRKYNVMVPAAMVYSPYRSRTGELQFWPSTSTGLACGTTREAAAERAVAEVVERDAVALAWLSGYRAPQVSDEELEQLAPPIRELLRMISKRDYHLVMLDLTTDCGIPVRAVLLGGHSSVGYIVSFGSAAAACPAQALTKALLEAAHARSYVRQLRRQRPRWRANRFFREVTGFADHALFYTAHPEYQSSLNFWWDAKPRPLTSRGSKPPVPVSNVLEALQRQEFQVLLADLTTPDIADLGLHVVRALVPGLQPLHGNHAWAHLGSSRLLRASEIFQVPSSSLFRELNQFPHPCP